VSLLRIFIQLNFTGPDKFLPSAQAELDILSTLSQEADKDSIIKTSLELDPNTRLPALLLVVKHLLSKGMSYELLATRFLEEAKKVVGIRWSFLGGWALAQSFNKHPWPGRL